MHNDLVGNVHSFESFATLDGEGIRFAVFMQGCNLRCKCCHNVDTQPFGIGQNITAEEIVAKAVRYKPYFKDNGGVTFSGGEPLCQAGFVLRCMEMLEQEGIGVAVDTSGSVLSKEAVEVIKKAKLIILDIKFADEKKYNKLAGFSLAKTLEFLDLCEVHNKRVWLRSVIIPTINDTEGDISKYYNAIKHYNCVENYELLGFHTMGFDKYKRLEIKNDFENIPPMDKAKLEKLQDYLDNLRGVK